MLRQIAACGLKHMLSVLKVEGTVLTQQRMWCKQYGLTPFLGRHEALHTFTLNALDVAAAGILQQHESASALTVQFLTCDMVAHGART